MEWDSLEDLMNECLYAFELTKLLELSEQFFLDEFGKPVHVTKEDFLETCKMLVINSEKSLRNSLVTPKSTVMSNFHYTFPNFLRKY